MLSLHWPNWFEVYEYVVSIIPIIAETCFITTGLSISHFSFWHWWECLTVITVMILIFGFLLILYFNSKRLFAPLYKIDLSSTHWTFVVVVNLYLLLENAIIAVQGMLAGQELAISLIAHADATFNCNHLFFLLLLPLVWLFLSLIILCFFI